MPRTTFRSNLTYFKAFSSMVAIANTVASPSDSPEFSSHWPLNSEFDFTQSSSSSPIEQGEPITYRNKKKLQTSLAE